MITVKKTNLILIVIITLLGACNSGIEATDGTISDFTSRIDSLLYAKTEQPFNGVVLIAQAGEPIYSRVMGYSDLENKTPLNDSSQFIIGSISKQITAVIILREFDKGHLQPDIPIHQYLPELRQGWADSVTVIHLLTHMHGIAGSDKPLAFKAGTKFDYGLANTGYDLLASIAEKTSGKTFAELSLELFKQCGMTHTFHPDIKKYNALVKGYSEQAPGIFKFDSTSFQNAPAAGGFISNAGDLVLWNEHLHNGKLLKPATYAMMISKQKNAVRQHPIWGPTDYGLGVTISDKDSILQLGQTGFAPGFASMNFYFPETQTSIIVLENTARNTNDLKNTFRYHIEILNLLKDWIY